MTKVVKVYLISKVLNANGEEVKYKDVNNLCKDMSCNNKFTYY